MSSPLLIHGVSASGYNCDTVYNTINILERKDFPCYEMRESVTLVV